MGRYGFSRQIQTRAMSSVYGKIEVMLLAFPGSKESVTKKLVMNRYGEIFKAFNDRVTFVVLGHFGEGQGVSKDARRAFEEAMEDTNIDPEHHLVFCHTPLAGVIDFQKGDVHSEFIQDPIISMETELGTIVLLDPMKQVNPENSNIAEQLAAYTGYLVQPCSIELEGGNILVGDDYALVGMNILYQNLELGKKMDANEPEKWVANHLKSLLGLRYLLWIGAENSFDFEDFHSTGNHQLQPFFHIDLFLTLAGKASGSKELVFLGRIDKKFVFDLAPGEGEWIDKLNVLLDAVESHLESSGEAFPGPRFEVARLDMGGRIVAEEGIRRFVPYSYNNSQVEWYRGFARIYLPSYKGLEILEQRVTEQLSRLDFKYIKFIHGPFAEYAENGGSLHCITNILQRGQF